MGCEELKNGKTCSGYKLQKEVLLNLEEEYSQIMAEQMIKKERK